MPTELSLNVTFTSQAPTKDWNLPFQEACEEASLIMVKHYLRNEFLSTEEATQDIINLVNFESEHNMGVDIGADQVLEVAQNFYGLEGKVYKGELITKEKIKDILIKGSPIIVPVAGQILNNPNYTGVGPPYHMLVVVGYNQNGFITHDPGTQFGAYHEYSYDTFMNAIHDWTGSKSTVLTGEKALVVLY